MGWVSAQDPGTVSLNSGTEVSKLKATMGRGEGRAEEKRKKSWGMLGTDLIFFPSTLLHSHLGMQGVAGFVNDSLYVNQLTVLMLPANSHSNFLLTQQKKKKLSKFKLWQLAGYGPLLEKHGWSFDLNKVVCYRHTG